MSFYRAYYSIVQYCPDRSRAEAANIGVLVLCPELRFVRARMSANPGRVRKFFGSHSFDAKRFRIVASAIETNVREKYDWSEGLADLERYIATRANDIQLTPARAMKTADPLEDLDALFMELVEGPLSAVAKEAEHWAPPSFARLDSSLKAPGVRERIKFDESIDVPVLGTTLTIPYVYENGATNLVKPVAFKGRPSAINREASDLAVEGGLLRKHSTGRVKQLIVLPAFTPEAQSSAERVETVLADFGVRVVPEEALEHFIHEVASTAH